MSPDSVDRPAAEAEADTAANDPAVAPDEAGPTGFVDVISGNRISGWVWDPDRPERRFDVDIRFDGSTLATVRADRHRNDLVSAGIGDGRYGFETRHKVRIGEDDCRRVTAVVVAQDGQEAVELTNRVARTLRNSVLRPEDVLVLRTAIEDWPKEQKALVEHLARRLLPLATELRRLRECIEEKPEPAEDKLLADGIAAIRRAQDGLDRRMAEIDGFHSRFDRALAELQKPRKPEPPVGGDSGLRRMVMLLSAVSVTSLILGLVSILR